MMVWNWIRLDVVIADHDDQIALHGGSGGIRDAGGLKSALANPKNLANHDTPDLAALAAEYLFSIAKNHPFVDGNKRTAWITCNGFVMGNGGHYN